MRRVPTPWPGRHNSQRVSPNSKLGGCRFRSAEKYSSEVQQRLRLSAGFRASELADSSSGQAPATRMPGVRKLGVRCSGQLDLERTKVVGHRDLIRDQVESRAGRTPTHRGSRTVDHDIRRQRVRQQVISRAIDAGTDRRPSDFHRGSWPQPRLGVSAASEWPRLTSAVCAEYARKLLRSDQFRWSQACRLGTVNPSR
jgi:hypothetical protein